MIHYFLPHFQSSIKFFDSYFQNSHVQLFRLDNRFVYSPHQLNSRRLQMTQNATPIDANQLLTSARMVAGSAISYGAAIPPKWHHSNR